jgi:hypothetical protein
MARPNSEFVLAWSSLFNTDVFSGWQAISLAPAGPVEIQAGRRFPDNSEAVLFCFPNGTLPISEKLPEGKGFVVERTDFSGGEGLCLALTRKTDGSLDLFASMVCDIVGAIDDVFEEGASESALLRVFLSRVRAWQHFMSRGAAPLSAEAELGLVGELYFLNLFLDSGLSETEILNGWVGPDDSPQDFHLGQGAIEVKATMSSSGFPVRIGSLEQLDDSILSPLFLAAVRFTRTEAGTTLPELVSHLEARISGEPGAVDLLHQRLLMAGYFSNDAGHYSRRFEPKEKRIFLVDEAFPRLTQGIVPLGVTKVNYELNLDHAGEFTQEFSLVLSQLGMIK